MSSTAASVPIQVPTSQNNVKRSLNQQTIKQYFPRLLEPAKETTRKLLPTCSIPTSHNKHQHLLSYSHSPPHPSIHKFLTTSIPAYKLQEAWGHSLPVIDPSQIFRVFLQNPNGLNLYHNNLPLQHDFKLCSDYGSGVICFPETNINWNIPDKGHTFNSIHRRTWQHSVSVTSRSPEDFLSQYQPGGTTTIICNNWTSRVITKGGDPLGLGKWSFVTLRGRGGKKITIITAYNASYNTGDTTNFRQQQHTLTQLHIQNNQRVKALPCRQFILDLQAWLESLISQDHELILTMDANEGNDPDNSVPLHPLSYKEGVTTMDKAHDGKLSTLISSCRLVNPLARHHSSRPIPASHIKG